MAGIAALVLRGIQLDIVRRGIFPGWERIEVGQETIAVIIAGADTGWNVTQYHVLVGSFRRPQRIIADLKVHLGGVAGTTGQARLIDSNVAAVTVFIGYGVADLALEVTQVLLMLVVAAGVGPNILMAVFAFYHVRILISGSCGLAGTVKFLTVAFGADHALLCPVNVTRDSLILPEILSTNTGAVTGNTVVLHGWSSPKLVPGNKPATRLIRSTDMTLPARGVALLAMILKGYGQRGAFFQIPTSGFKDRFKAAERRVEANIIHVGDVLVAGIAITLGRVNYQSYMC